MPKLVLICAFLFLIAACSSNPARKDVTPSSSAEVRIAMTPTTTETLIPTTNAPPTPTIQKNTPKTATQASTPTPVVKLCSPLELHDLEQLPEIIGDPYQPPRPGREERHHGVDFAYYHYQDRDSMLGEPVQSILAGKVASVLDDHYPYGNMVIIETEREELPDSLVEELEIADGSSLYLLYAHLDQPPSVELSERVGACQRLGEVGMSGNTDIPHLHIETRLGPPGQVFDSMRYYDTRATLEELAAYELWRVSGVFEHFDPMILLGVETDIEEKSEDQ
jgi:murein DD-endopeptidase MepM/ murein hydrolase activator NlpD